MRSSRWFALASASCLALAVVMTASAISLSAGRDAFELHELLDVDELPAEPANLLDDHLVFAFEVFSGTRTWTQEDLDERFSPNFTAGFGVDRMKEVTAAAIEERGTTSFVRRLEREPRSIRALGVAEDGTPMVVWLQTSDQGLMESFLLEVVPSSPRLDIWGSTMLLLAAWLFVVVAVAARRSGEGGPAWILLLGSAASSGQVLMLSDASGLYTVGRLLPALLVPIAVGVLWPSPQGSPPRGAMALAGVAAMPALIAPFVRDAGVIGHPEIVGSIADSGPAYRTLLVLGAVLIGLVMAATSVAAGRRALRSVAPRRSIGLAAAGAAGLWALGSAGSALDYLWGGATWAGGVFGLLSLCALVAVPGVAILRLVNDRWDRTDLAALVVDLDANDVTLAAAVAKAMDDPTLRIITSPDGIVLLDQDGETVTAPEPSDRRTLTEIRSGGRLIGGLVHDPRLNHNPDRLRAVAAAAGMALEVERLNRQVSAQLDEVNASRTRIVQAADTARRQVERDLHDGAQQRLVALGLQLQRARRLATSKDEAQLATLLEDATVEVRRSIDEIRAVSRGSQPALLAERGLGPAVDALAERSPVPVRIDIPPEDLDPAIETTAYYVIAEALTNVAKHADATEAAVTVKRANGHLDVRVVDDGSGGATAAPGSGLEGLADRVAAASGTIDIASDGRGTALQATIPCE